VIRFLNSVFGATEPAVQVACDGALIDPVVQCGFAKAITLR
jgi:hypothetical protein